MTPAVVLIDDEDHMRAACTQALELADVPVEAFARARQALDRIGTTWPGVVVTDVKMPGDDGMAVLARVLEIDPDIPVILMTGHGDVPMAVSAMRQGAYDFIEKPFATDVFVDAVRRALDRRQLVMENRALRSALSDSSDLDGRLIGRTPEMARLRDTVRSFGATDADVLVNGETGVGKEVVARALHDAGPRAGGRFVAINCGALPETVIESELFGHEAGAFTGAAKKRIGRIQHADGGTVFLDEIESMPLDLQTRLLRVLQARTLVPLGSNDEVSVDVRVVAATKEDLKALAAEGRFREDLVYRLDVLSLTVPPLRDRRDDIPLLFQHFVNEASERFKKPAQQVGPETIASIMAQDWPGNVRELQNAALRYALGADAAAQAGAGVSADLATRMEAFERRVIDDTLRRNGGQLKATYEALGISRKTLYEKLRKLGISTEGGSDA